MFFMFKIFFVLTLLMNAVILHTGEKTIPDFVDAWGEHGISVEHFTRSGISLNFSMTELEMLTEKLDGETVHSLHIPGVFLPNDEGAPNLPVMSRYIAIPQGAQARLNVTSSRFDTLHNINIKPAPRIPPGIDDSPLEYIHDPEIYSRDAYYPQNPVILSEQTKIRGLDVVIISITPFQYNPITKELIIYRDLKLEVDFIGGSGHFGDDRLRSRWFDPILYNTVINPEQIPPIDYSSRSTRDDQGYEYIVFVPDDPAFSAWGDSIRLFRSQQGIKTELVTTTEVGGNDHVMIKNYISYAYDNWDIPPVAVLLLADYGTSGSTITSELRFDHPVAGTWPPRDSTYITDHYYSDMNDNLMPDIIMSRITAQNRNDLENMVGKFMNYERHPPTNTDFYNEPITAMGWQTERWFQISAETVNGFWEFELNKNPLRQNAIYSTSGGDPDTLQFWSTNDNTPMVMNVFGPDGLGYIPDNPQHLQNYGWDADNVSLNNAINSGAFMVLHRNHGNVNGWGQPHYRNDHLSGLENVDLPFVFSINCLTGRFNSGSDCFAEAIHKHQYGALGVIAATAISYSFVNDAFVWGMFNHMWPDFLPDYGTNPESYDVLPAFANAAGKYFLQQSSWPTNPNRKEITYRVFHNHGDAFSHVFTEIPQTLTVLHDNYIFADEQYITITANEGAFIALSVNGEIIATAEATSQPIHMNVSNLSPPDVVNLTVTKQNYSRYDAKIGVVSFAGGVGTYNDPFQISTHGHLYSVRYFCNTDNIYFELINKIDLTAKFLLDGTYYNLGQGWVPIGNSWSNVFKGTFDGADHQIKGLFINNVDNNMQGLFGNIEGATILNLGVTNANITGNSYVGSLVGRSYNSTITNCYTTGTVIGDSYVGGLAGRSLSNSTLSTCFSIGTIIGSSYVGGLVGDNYISSNIINSYSSGSVTSTGNFAGGLVGNNFQSTVSNSFSNSFVNGDQYVGGLIGFNDTSVVNYSYSKGDINGSSSVGGLIGRNWYNSDVNSSYSTGSVSGTSSVGGLVGFNYGSINSSYWDMQTSGQNTSSGGTGRDTEEMTYPYTENTYSGWNFIDIWAADNNYTINQGYPYLIGQYNYDEQPIGEGTNENPYRIASLDNLAWVAVDETRWDKYYIQTNDITASQTSAWNAGTGWSPIGNNDHHFTGNYDGGGYIIDGLYINRPNNNYQGLFGYTNGAMVKNLSLINIDITGHDYVGGLIGNNHLSSVNNCYTGGNVHGNWWVGGLTGRNNSFSNVRNSYSISSVSGVSRVGGMIGSNSNYSSLRNSYSRGEVNATDGYSGGLVGYNYFESLVINSYSVGLVSGSGSYIGGLVGRNQISSVSGSYWNTETSGQTTSDGGEGRTTDEMTYPYAANTYLDWAFEEIWLADEHFLSINDGYPYHIWCEFGIEPFEGDGTSENPYKIDNIAHLLWIGADVTRWDKHYIQVSDIDASITSYWDSGWKPIGNSLVQFTGTYNGNGFIIDGLFINRQNCDYQGLFGHIREATITNLSVINAEFHGKSYIGGITGRSDSSLISYCYTKGDFSGLSYVGGLVGYNFGTVKECYTKGNINGNDYLGGLIGSNSSLVDDSYSRCNVTGNNYLGGLIGNNSSTVNNSFSTGMVIGNHIVGGLIGWNTGIVSHSYWDMDTSGIASSETGEGRSTEQMIFPSANNTYDGWNYDSIWVKGLYYNINDGYPHLNWQGNPPIVPTGTGTPNNPYIIASLGNLYWITGNYWVLDKHYLQIADIDASDTFFWTDGGLEPIGYNFLNAFTGSYDGNGFTIDSLYINRDRENLGLFGITASGATISNLGITNASISNGDGNFTGSLVGRSSNSIITGCYGENNYVSSNGNDVGGLIGRNDNSEVIKCFSSNGNVTGFDHVGGLIGNSGNFSILNNNYSTASVSGQDYVGGLLGKSWYTTLHNSYSIGSVNGIGVHVGGLVGGNNDHTSVYYSYWNTETSGQTTSAGGFGRTTAHMTYPYSTHSYVDWDFTDIWANDYDHEFNDGYPFLSHEVVIDEFPWFQDFTGIPIGHIPSGWSRSHSNWFVTNSSYAGGETPEVKFYYHPSSSSAFRLVTPPIRLDNVYCLNLSFKHRVSDNLGGYSLRLQISSDQNDWDTVWEISPTGNIDPETVDLLLSDLSGHNLYIAWVFYGNSSNIYSWEIDDILLETYDLLPPTNLEAVGGDGVVYLSWDAPDILRTKPEREVLISYEHERESARMETETDKSQFIDSRTTTDLRERKPQDIALHRDNHKLGSYLQKEKDYTQFPSDSLMNYPRSRDRTEINYNIYRNGLLINTVGQTSYADFDVINGTPYNYYVTAVYDEGESQPSNTVSVTPTLPVVIDEYPWHEDFSGVTMGGVPDGWIRTHTNWKVYDSAYAGGEAPEIMFVNSPISTDTFRLISPELNLNNMNQLDISFNQMVNHYTSEFTLKVQVSSDLENWDTVWEIVPTSNIEAETIELVLYDLDQDNLYIAWVFEGYSWNVNYWCIDDIYVMATHMMGGSYSICTDGTGDYISFNQAVDDLILYGITEAVTFTVAPGIYEEQILIPEIMGTSESNTITFTGFDSERDQPVLRYSPETSVDRYVVRLNGAKHIRFENLTIEVLDTANYGWAFHLMSGSENIEINNCQIYTQPSIVASDYAGIVISGSGSNLVTGASNVNDILIENNTIIGGYAGVYLRGVSQEDSIGELRLLSNTVLNNHFYGISILYSAEPIIKQNSIGALGTDNTAIIGINISDIYGSFEMAYNSITDIGSIGVLIFNTYTTFDNPSLIYNNMIGGFSQASANGMMFFDSNYLNLYYNSINLNTSGASDAIYVHDNANGLKIMNNSFAYTGDDHGRAAYYNSLSGILEHDYNNYYSGTSDLLIYYGSEISDLDDLQAVNIPFGNDQNSHVGYPGYYSDTDLRTQNVQLWQRGTPIYGIDDDMDGDVRDPENPCIGADEFSPLSDDLAAITIVGTSAPFKNEDNIYHVTVQNAGVNTQDQYSVKLMKMEGHTELASITVSEPLLSGDTTTHSLSWIPTTHGNFDLYGQVVLTGDDNPQNDCTKILPVVIIPISLPYYEDFSDIAIQTIPVGWTRTHSNWGVKNTNNAGGNVPEMQLERTPALTDLLRLSSVLLDGTNVSNLSLSFKHFLDENSYGSYSFTIKLQTSTDGIIWDDLQTIAVRDGEAIGNIGPETYTINLDGLVGETFYIAWVYDGETSGINRWNINDIEIAGLLPPVNLVAIPGDEVVELSWDAPDNLRKHPEGVRGLVFRDDSGSESDETFNILAGSKYVDTSLNRLLQGYNIYRDGVQLNVDPITETTYTDNDVFNGIMYSYYVTAIFTEGESGPSNTVEVIPNITVFAGGSGTAENPWQIETAEHLDNIRLYLGYEHNEKYFLQTSDIDLDQTPWNSGEGWTPIGSFMDRFYGNYDGDGHILEGLYINRPASSYIGLFGEIMESGIDNLGIVDANITGNEHVGIIVGRAENSSVINNCYSTGVVSGTHHVGGMVGSSFNLLITESYTNINLTGNGLYAGGLLGFSDSYSSVTRSYSKGSVNGDVYVGGLVGSSWNESIIEDSYSTATTEGNCCVGGLLGDTDEYSSVSNSYSTGNIISSSDDVGGLIGFNWDSIFENVENSYWDTQTSGLVFSAGGEGRTTDEMTYPYAANTYVDWDFVSIWSADEDYLANNGYPYHQWYELPQYFAPPTDLVAESGDEEVILNWQPPQTDILTRNVITEDRSSINSTNRELTGYNIYRDGYMINDDPIVETTYIDNDVVNGIMYSYYVTAVFTEGESGPSNTVEVIPNIPEFAGGSGTAEDPWQIETAEHLGNINNYLGEDHSDKHFELINDIDMSAWFDYRDGNYFDNDGWIPIGIDYDSPFKGSFDGNNHSIDGLYINRPNTDFQGLFGYIEEATITNLGVTNVSITGHSYVGALVGESFWYASVTNCFSTGSVSGEDYVGGLIGAKNDGTNLNNSFSTSIANGDYFVGGLIGSSYYATLSNNYSRGNVTGNAYVGGLIGVEGSSQINDCFSTGTVNGNIDQGGLIGHSMGSIIENCYWDIQASGINTSDGGEGRTTDEMTYPYAANTYVDWDFVSIWSADEDYLANNGYPYHQWYEVPQYFAPPTDLVAESGDEEVILNWQAPQIVIIPVSMLNEGGAPINQPNREFIGYNIHRDGSQLNVEPITETTYIDNDVVNSITYNYYVTAVYIEGESGPSNIVAATPLARPENLSAEAGDNIVELMWETPLTRTILGYNVYRDDVQINTDLVTETHYTDTDVINSTTYTYYVTAVYDVHGESVPSDSVEATPLAAPTDLTASYGDLYVELNWIAAGNGAVLTRASGFSDTRSRSSRSLQGYNLYRDGEQINTAVITETEYTDTDVEYDTSYSYYVTAVYSVHGESVASNTVDIYVPDKVATPTFFPEPGLYTDTIDVSIESATEVATIMYRTMVVGNTRDSWSDWQVYTDPITVSLDTEMNFEAYAEKDDWITSDTTEANYIVTGTVATPTFTPEPGIYTDEISITIETETDGATIHYRTSTDSGAWTDWLTYTEPINIPLDTEMDIEAYAEKNDWITSATADANYLITGTVATPTFSPEAGLYTDIIDVSIETETEAATIMYRTSTDGGTWTDWEIYTEPIAVPYDTQIDFEAYAEKSDWITSGTAAISYTVTGTVAMPTYTPEPGIYTEATDVVIETETEGATIWYRTSPDSTYWSDWQIYDDPIIVPLNSQQYFQSYAEKTDWITSETSTASYTVTGTVADPTFSPELGLYTEETDVEIETETEAATIMYRTSTDGGAWSDWEVYTDPITVPLNTEMDFEAYAEKNDWITSQTVSANYVVTGTVADPTFTPEPGIYTEATDVSIETDTEEATIMYRTSTDGGAWTDWQVYTAPVTVPLNTEMDFEAYAEKDDWITSETISANYIVTGTVADPTFLPEPGIYTEATDVSIETDTEEATIMYRISTDGGTWTDWQVYTDPITIPLDTEMDFEAYAQKDDWITSETVSANYVVTGTVADPTFSPEPGLYSEATDVSIETDTEGATIMYRTSTDGGAWTDWQVYTTPITVPLDTEMDFEAYAEKVDWITSQTISANYIITGTVADPTFTPEPGIYTEATDVIIQTDTEGATIMYRTATDGGVWTDWEEYTDAITVPLDTEMDFEAYAEKDDWITSQTVSANYIVTGTVADPTFSPEPGIYTEATDVSIETDTEGATIMYRTSTDGGAWTDWQVYTDPITVPLDTEMDFEVYAEKDDWITSETVSANYLVTGTVATPEFEPEGGVYLEAQIVTITTATTGATIEYSFDGEEWIEGDTAEIEYSTVLYARAYLDNWLDSEIAEDMYYILNPPQELQAEGLAGYVQLSWQEPYSGDELVLTTRNRRDIPTRIKRQLIDRRDSDNLIGYNVYRQQDDEFILLNTEPITETEYVDEELEADEYTYHVTAMYDQGESNPSNTATATVNMVATPEFSPEPGYYQEEIELIISCDTEEADIYYSLDGSEPTQESLLYTEPVTLDSTVTVKARAFKEDWLPSDIAEAFYEIEITDAEDDILIPLVTALHNNYPNPFNPETTIDFSLSQSGLVTIEIYNIRGQKVRTLINSEYAAGQHSVVWDSRGEQGREVSGGVYLYRFISRDHIETRRMLLLK